MVREKEKIRLVEKAAAASGASTSKPPVKSQTDIKDTGYGKDIKGKKRDLCNSQNVNTYTYTRKKKCNYLRYLKPESLLHVGMPQRIILFIHYCYL